MRKLGAAALFVFALCSAVGGVAAVLQFFRVNPEGFTTPIQHAGWLVVVLLLFFASVGTAGYSAYVTFRHGTRSSRLDAAILGGLWSQWAAVGDMYERLDYDNRGNVSTRHPFSNSSWPQFGEPWSYVQVELYKNRQVVDVLKGHTDPILQAFGWTDYSIPRTEEGVVMVDFIRDVREFQTYLNRRLRSA